MGTKEKGYPAEFKMWVLQQALEREGSMQELCGRLGIRRDQVYRWQRKFLEEGFAGTEKRLRLVAEDLVQHFEERQQTLDGKAMIVCMSRRICVALHEEIIRLRPSWHSQDDNGGVLKVVMTGSAADGPEWQQHIGDKRRREAMAKRFKNASDPLKLSLFFQH